MSVSAKSLLFAVLLTAVVLAGCSGAGPGSNGGTGNPTEAAEANEVEVTDTTGGIRGVVVDEAIRPISGAQVDIAGADEVKQLITSETGVFTVSGLNEGTYLIKASHPLYSQAQQSVDVVAGEKEPTAIKIQLVREVFAEPYLEVLKYDGFIVCSANAVLPVVGGVLSEECGEGAGVPGVGRVGGQSNNNVQFDFTVANDGVKTIVIEQVWNPTSEAGNAFYSPISTEWSCDPFCGGNTFSSMEGVSPLLARIDDETIAELELVPAETFISVFTWASPDSTPIGVVLNQKYEVFATNFYFVPAPEGWSFVNGGPDPFK